MIHYLSSLKSRKEKRNSQLKDQIRPPHPNQQGMEFHNPIKLSAETATVTASLLTIMLLFYYLVIWKKNSKQKPPQPSGSWPFIGHLPLLGKLSHITLGKLADEYGPIFMIKLGVNRTLVISTAEMAQECLGTNDKIFLNRPQTVFVEHLGYNSAMFGFSPYGAHWREMRKIAATEVLSNHKVELFKHIWMSEVRSAIKTVHDSCLIKRKVSPGCDNVSVDMKLWFYDITLNTSVRLVAGKSMKEFYPGEEHEQCTKALMDFFKLVRVFVPADDFPFLRWFDIGGYEKAMKKAAKAIDHVAQGWLEEHKRRQLSGEEKEKDFMDVMLGIYEKAEDIPKQFEADTIIKATSMGIMLAGIDTTAVTLTRALSLLINNTDCLKKAQTEIDTHVGKERQVDESDLDKLVYLLAILKETMRLYPPSPLLVREAIADCTVSSYQIPKGTRLFVNLYKIHRKPESWADPLGFNPERFLTTHIDYDVRGQNFEFLPFGSGRRMCPGISFALKMMQFTLANLLQGFNISTLSNKAVDRIEDFGQTNQNAAPLEVLLNPRLPDHVYNNHSMVVG